MDGYRKYQAKRSRQRKAARAAGVKQAPGELESVRAFASTVARDRRADGLATPARLARWLQDRGLLDLGITLDEAQLESAHELRRGLRALILANSGAEADAAAVERFQELAGGGRFALRFEDGVPVGFGPVSRGFDDALGAIGGIVAKAWSESLWQRLKICARSDCGRAFFDTSPSRTGRWCSPRCGERHRAARYRSRR